MKNINWYAFIVNAFFTIGGYAVISIPNGLVGIALFTIAGYFTSSYMTAALMSGLGGMVWAYVFFNMIMPIFKLPPQPFKLMLGWYIAYGLGFSLGPIAAQFLHQTVNLPWPAFFTVLCCGGLPLLFASCLTPLGIVGFPNRKFDN